MHISSFTLHHKGVLKKCGMPHTRKTHTQPHIAVAATPYTPLAKNNNPGSLHQSLLSSHTTQRHTKKKRRKRPHNTTILLCVLVFCCSNQKCTFFFFFLQQKQGRVGLYIIITRGLMTTEVAPRCRRKKNDIPHALLYSLSQNTPNHPIGMTAATCATKLLHHIRDG